MKISTIGFFIRKYFVILTSLILGCSIVFDFDRAILFDLFFCACFVLMPFPDMLECFCFLMPLASTYEFAHVFLIVLFLFILKRKSINIKTIAAVLVVLLLEIVTYTLYNKTSFNRMLGYLLTISLVLFLIYERRMPVNKEVCIKMYVIGLCVFFAMYVLSAFMMLGSNFLYDIFQGSQRFGTTSSQYFSGMAIDINANYLAYYSICGMACILTLMRTGRLLQKHKVTWILIFAFIMLVGTLTVSRAWILTAFILFFVYSLANNGNFSKTLYRFLGIALVGAVVLIYLDQTTSIVDSFVRRFTDENIVTGGNRTTTIREYLDVFFSSIKFMLLGTGVTDYTKIIASYFSMHNALIQILVCCGIPGTIFVLTALYAPMITAFRKKVPLIYWLPAIVVFVFTQTIQFLDPATLMLPHIIGVMALQMRE